jgi:hypothetical protein
MVAPFHHVPDAMIAQLSMVPDWVVSGEIVLHADKNPKLRIKRGMSNFIKNINK